MPEKLGKNTSQHVVKYGALFALLSTREIVVPGRNNQRDSDVKPDAF